MRVQFDQKPSKMLILCRLNKAAASSSLSGVFKNTPGIWGLEFFKTQLIGLIRKSI